MIREQRRLAAAVARIAAATSVIRTRGEDVVRLSNNGSTEEAEAALLALVERLERVADELEKAIKTRGAEK